jgi:flagellar biosynthesis regulator FlaF
MRNLTGGSDDCVENNNKNDLNNKKIDAIFNEIKSYIDDIKDYGLNENKRDEVSSIISFAGMILDELSNSIKKANLSNFNLEKISTEDLDIKLSNLLSQLKPYYSEKKTEMMLDELADYCNAVFMELMSGHSCAVPEKH